MNIKDTRTPSNRSFGIIFSVFFLILFFIIYRIHSETYFFLLFLSFSFFILGLLNSKILLPLNKLWIGFGNFLGSIISPVVMFLIFFFVITPIGMMMKILKKNYMDIKYNRKIDTYWIKRKSNEVSFKDQF